MPTFRTADREAFDLVESIVNEHYPDLSEADVKVGILFAHAKEGVETCLSSGGYPVAIKPRIISTKDRVAGMPDAQILIDGNRWEEWDDARRAAALDGMLYAILVQRDKEGVIKTDDAERPKLKLRAPDFRLEGFGEIAERHGEASLEVSTAKSIVDEFGQHLFPFMEISG